MNLITLILAFLFTSGCLCGLYVIPERIYVEYYNPKYYGWLKAYVGRKNRKSPVYTQLSANLLITLDKDVTCHLKFLEYLHNEYRPSFVEMHNTYCNFLNKDMHAIGIILRHYNFTCPLLPGIYDFKDISLILPQFSWKFPFEKGRIDAECENNRTNEKIHIFRFYARFEKTK